ncbi:hypothetical protein FIC94_06825 [Ochrobactrum teleogrylli]|uniref:Uncharacterized protein n=1 Tax=Ochrobactrum teleogrylli TaxID=2479765 RepID=A0ABY2Y7J9_9HYPH|nr:hypothetical protein FIC94_06825 [[Ochrobactrum] teleogrylli]
MLDDIVGSSLFLCLPPYSFTYCPTALIPYSLIPLFPYSPTHLLPYSPPHRPSACDRRCRPSCNRGRSSR